MKGERVEGRFGERMRGCEEACGTCATPAAISIFMARPSRGTPSYCFMAGERGQGSEGQGGHEGHEGLEWGESVGPCWSSRPQPAGAGWSLDIRSRVIMEGS